MERVARGLILHETQSVWHLRRGYGTDTRPQTNERGRAGMGRSAEHVPDKKNSRHRLHARVLDCTERDAPWHAVHCVPVALERFGRHVRVCAFRGTRGHVPRASGHCGAGSEAGPSRVRRRGPCSQVQIRLVRMGLTGLTRVKARPKNAKLISGQGIDEGMYSWSDRSMITEWNASRTGCEAQVTETVERMVCAYAGVQGPCFVAVCNNERLLRAPVHTVLQQGGA